MVVAAIGFGRRCCDVCGVRDDHDEPGAHGAPAVHGAAHGPAAVAGAFDTAVGPVLVPGMVVAAAGNDAVRMAAGQAQAFATVGVRESRARQVF